MTSRSNTALLDTDFNPTVCTYYNKTDTFIILDINIKLIIINQSN